MKHTSILSLAAFGALLFPFAASAHEHHTYQIGDKQYSVVVGSLNEPAHVDDKSGVEFMVSDLSQPAAAVDDGDGDDDGPVGSPVTGLEQTLKVEVSAGDQKKTFDLEPIWGKPGNYQAVFYPTVETTYAYRIFGTLNNAPLDITYTCTPRSTEESPEVTTPLKLSDTVTQLSKGGAFGCFDARQAIEFPLTSATNADMAKRLSAVEKKGISTTGTTALALSVVAFIFAISANRKNRKI